MDVNKDKEFGPELSEMDVMMLLAQDLVGYIMFRSCANYNLEWEPIEFRKEIYNSSVPVMRRVINFLHYTLEWENDDLFCEMEKGEFLNAEGYERFVKALDAKYFPEGFDANYFLVYCLNLSSMAAYFHTHKIIDAPDLAKIHICQFLERYGVSAVGWDAICRSAENIVKMLRVSLNELTPPNSSLVSDEIEHQDREYEKMSDESNTSQSEEKSVLLGNEENNHDQQKARTFTKIEKYLKKYAQCYSPSRPDVGLCSLIEPEALSADNTFTTFIFEGNKVINISKSDVNPRPGTSNFIQELTLIINDFKTKMYLLRNEIRTWYVLVEISI